MSEQPIGVGHADPRTAAQRKTDTLAKLAEPTLDGWVATADGSGRAHLVPLSLLWTGDHVVIAVETSSLTARNIIGSGAARIGVGATRDVMMIDVVLDRAVPVAGAPAAIAEGYAAQADWDPRAADGEFVYLVLRPARIQAWREVNELAGRTLMRSGTWVV